MKVEFVLKKFKEDSYALQTIRRFDDKALNELVIVGADEEDYHVLMTNEHGLTMIPGLSLMDFSVRIPKDQITNLDDGPGVVVAEFDIPTKYITTEELEGIQKVQEELGL